ncbi:transcriptional regulator [Chitinophaga sp. SYP-B3965]|uniref:winged helix-turn-helix transcriptional regulator n=1 Tax=Chitinophaga sp. SYP-B3965 TaxID=2663120 RepID=UPI001299638B|nr:helix-turn-helix domain-containing protein [Chitinophaga sp. SYP-B3965]MRG45759.1 transcriptional regulator [Chitinophaga sp. SYP-B3965]
MKDRVLHAPDCLERLPAIDDALYVIGGKWKLRIIIALSDGNKRFNELQRLLKGISARVLSNELKDLEQNGFLKRIVYAEASPPLVEYERTEYADTLKQVVMSLHEWGAMHKKNIMQRSKEEMVTNDKG